MNSTPELSEDDALSRLAGLGAKELRHVHGDLFLHLKGTYRVLQRWGAPRHVCMAGLYHAVYGTAGFADQLLPLDRRSDVVALIGDAAEELVYLFSACDRRDFYPRLRKREDPLRFRDRFLDSTFVPPAALVASLCELTLANELEIVLKADPSRRAGYRPFITALLGAMGPFASASAAADCRALLAALPLSPAAGSSIPAPTSNSP